MTLSLLALIIAAVALYCWLARPRLRLPPWWDGVVAAARAVLARAGARLRGLCGNSKTIAVAYAAELLGADSAGRVMVIMGVVMIVLRLVTRTAVNFKPES